MPSDGLCQVRHAPCSRNITFNLSESLQQFVDDFAAFDQVARSPGAVGDRCFASIDSQMVIDSRGDVFRMYRAVADVGTMWV